MALSAALVAQSLRPASLLPAIKCSQCGQEIEIAQMADHLCGEASSEEAEAQPSSMPPPTHATGDAGGHSLNPEPQSANLYNPFTLRQLNASGQKPATSPLQYSATAPPGTQTPVVAPPQMVAPKPRRIAPPRIDSGNANRPFLAPRPPRSDSPMSPAVSVRSGRSARGNLFDFRPPSPELTGNMDCAFPPFPTAPPPRPSSRSGNSAGRRTPVSDRSDSRNNSRADGRFGGDTSHGFEPSSPRGIREDNFQRPFESRRRRPSEASTLSSYDRRRPSIAGNNREELPPLPTEPLPPNALQIARPTTPGNNFSRPGASAAVGRTAPPARLSPTEEGDLSGDPFSGPGLLPSGPLPEGAHGDRSMATTQEGTNENLRHTLTKVISEPEVGGKQERPPLHDGPDSEPAKVPQFRPRSSSRAALRPELRLDDAPPMPKPIQQTQEDTAHSPSNSNSSMASMTRSENNSTSDRSPIGSAASSLDTFSPLSYTSGHYEEDSKMTVAGLSVKPLQRPTEQAPIRSPPRNFARPALPKQLALVAGPDDPPRPSMPFANSTPMESPADPMLLTGKTYQPPPGGPQFRPVPTRTVTTPNFGEPQPAPLGALPSLPRAPLRSKSNASLSDYRSPAAAPPVPQGSQRSQAPARRPTNGKATCRGCGLIIEGKSIKAADGRLTGRWHKACFTCKTCDQPFTTADFYVIANLPYCEQHYHEKNGSCCHGCRKGIEGQYLETSSGTSGDKKFHPRCFTCVDCREVLVDDCFELGGKVYCERHALAAMRSQSRMAGSPLASGLSPSDRRGLTAERRTTKLMMIGAFFILRIPFGLDLESRAHWIIETSIFIGQRSYHIDADPGDLEFAFGTIISAIGSMSAKLVAIDLFARTSDQVNNHRCHHQDALTEAEERIRQELLHVQLEQRSSGNECLPGVDVTLIEHLWVEPNRNREV
nr:paxillin-like protein 1 [Quercus suber]